MNYGMRVRIKLKYFDEETILRNVTEIHYNYRSDLSSLKEQIWIAFESDIHSIGIIYPMSKVEEFETSLEKKKEAKF
jgi:hypothetical protein